MFHVKQCKAMNREVRRVECKKIQEELPTHFCKGCLWFRSHFKYRPHKKGGTYRLYLPHYMKVALTKEARRQGVTINRLIISKLGKDIKIEAPILGSPFCQGDSEQ